MAKKRPISAPRPGALLRAKRLENDWPLAQVARALCLAERQLRALEEDDYARLPGRAYILGYWQNYAALLGLADDDAIAAAVAAHKSRLPQQGARIALRAESRRAHGSLETARLRWALGFGALAAVFIASLWLWRGADDGFSLALPKLPAEVEWRRWPGAQPAPVSPPSPPQNGAPASTAIADASMLPEPNFPDNSSRHARSLLSGRTEEPPADSTVMPAAPESPLETAAVAATETATATETNPDQLVLAVREQSWIEVHDGDGRRLVYRSVARGSHLTLQGAPPFAVFIGNPAGVSVEYRGRPVPFTAANGGLFARFNIGVP